MKIGGRHSFLESNSPVILLLSRTDFRRGRGGGLKEGASMQGFLQI